MYLRKSSSALQAHKHTPGRRSNLSVPVNVQLDNHVETISLSSNNTFDEHYMKYDHDEVPVKDTDFNVEVKRSLTNVDLDELELKILKNLSQDFKTDSSNSLTDLESNIKYFKMTVQNILDKFYNSMADFELYKKRFNEILSKKDEDAIADVEDFIKDIIQHIIKSETSLSNKSKKNDTNNNGDSQSIQDENTNVNRNEFNSLSNATTTLATLEHSQSCSVAGELVTPTVVDNTTTADENSVSKDSLSLVTDSKENITSESTTAKDVCNIYLLGSPYVKIKIHEKHLLSEMDIRTKLCNTHWNAAVDVYNIRRRAAKRLERQQAVLHCDDSDKEIPVKVSYAKQNIPFEEDCLAQEQEYEKSFLTKFCDFICRKLRRS